MSAALQVQGEPPGSGRTACAILCKYPYPQHHVCAYRHPVSTSKPICCLYPSSQKGQAAASCCCCSLGALSEDKVSSQRGRNSCHFNAAVALLPSCKGWVTETMKELSCAAAALCACLHACLLVAGQARPPPSQHALLPAGPSWTGSHAAWMQLAPMSWSTSASF